MEESWGSAVFELFNVANGREYEAIYREALRGHVSKESWTVRNLRLEHKALRRLARFYKEVWEPFALQNGLRSDASIWRVKTPDDYEDWIRRYSNEVLQPGEVGELYYDGKIVPYLSRRGLSQE